MAFEWVYWLVGFLIVAYIFTYVLNKRFNVQTYHIISLIRTKRFNGIINGLARHKRFWEILADIGAAIGFGLIAVDYMFGKRQKSGKRRFAVDLIGFILLLCFSYILVYILASGNPATKDIVLILTLITALFGISAFSLVLLGLQAFDIIAKLLIGKVACPGVAPIIPGVKIPGLEITPPIIEVIIAFAILLIVHEFGHGILIRKAKLKLKSTGLVLLGFIPIGAFAEPDEKELSKAKPREQLRVYAIGSMNNLIMFFIVFVLLLFVVAPVFAPMATAIAKERSQGVAIVDVQEKIDICGSEYKADAYGKLRPGMLIKEIDGKKVETAADLALARVNAKNNELSFLVDSNGLEENYSVKLNELRSVGITVQEKIKAGYVEPLEAKVIAFVSSLFSWVWLLNLAVAIVNFLPSIPFDGGKMMQILLPDYLKFWKKSRREKEKKLAKIFLYIIVILLILNAVPLFLQ